MGFDADIVEDGQEAIAAHKEKKYDLIFMDMQMPVMDGVEATQAIRKFDKNVNIVGLTANAFSSDKQTCLDAGMNKFLTKPITAPILQKTIDEFEI